MTAVGVVSLIPVMLADAGGMIKTTRLGGYLFECKAVAVVGRDMTDDINECSQA